MVVFCFDFSTSVYVVFEACWWCNKSGVYVELLLAVFPIVAAPSLRLDDSSKLHRLQLSRTNVFSMSTVYGYSTERSPVGLEYS